MNERIKELAEQATKEVWGNNPFNGSPEFERHELDPEKFAELIIKECLNFVEPMPGSGDIDDLALEAAHNGIKKHFGVE